MQKREAQPFDTDADDKRQKFVEIAEARMARAVKAIRTIGRMAGSRSLYRYSEPDVDQMVGALTAEIESMKARLLRDKREQPTFRFGS